jgi:hypothetical protein
MIGERQAINGFVDGLMQAAELMLKLECGNKNPHSSKMFVQAMAAASGYADILGNYQQNMDWYRIRDMIETLTINCSNMAIDNMFGKKPITKDCKNGFLEMSKLLKNIAQEGRRIAESPAISRSRLIESCNLRKDYVSKKRGQNG